MFPVVLRGIRKSYGEYEVLRGVDLQIEEGGILAIVGANGVGKTVLMRILAGLEEADEGEIDWGGERRARDRSRGMVMQHSVVLRRSVRKNVEFALKGVGRGERDALVTDALSLVGLEGEGDSFAPKLSGGQQRKLSIAQAWVMKPKLLLLDEPTTHLDSRSVGEFESLVREVASRGEMKVVMTSHDKGQVERVADHVGFIEEGVMRYYERVSDFFGEGD